MAPAVDDNQLRQVIDAMESERLLPAGQARIDGDAAAVDADGKEGRPAEHMDDDPSPLDPGDRDRLTRSVSPTPSSMTLRQRRRRRQWTVFVVTAIFIFTSIAFVCLYFAIPRLIKAHYLDGVLAGDQQAVWRDRVRVDSVRMQRLTDRHADLEIDLRLVDMDRLPIGCALQLVETGSVHYGRAEVARFRLPRPIYLPRATGEFAGRIPLSLAISDPEGFAGLLGDFLVEPTITVQLAGDLLVKPDWLPSLPTIPVRLSLALEGGPLLIKERMGSIADGLAVDVVDGTADCLTVRLGLARAVPLQGALPAVSLTVWQADDIKSRSGNAIGRLYYPPRLAGPGTEPRSMEMEAAIGPWGEGLRSLLSGRADRILVRGDPEHSHRFLRPLLQRLSLGLLVPPDLRYVFPMVKEIVLLDLFGSTASIAANPFSVPVHVHSLDSMTVWYEGRVIGSLSGPCTVDQVIPPKTGRFRIEQPSGSARLRYEGGMATAIRLMRAILKSGRIDVDVDGEVTVSLGAWRADRLPVAQRNIPVSSKKKLGFRRHGDAAAAIDRYTK